jgi:hypothetical protein
VNCKIETRNPQHTQVKIYLWDDSMCEVICIQTTLEFEFIVIRALNLILRTLSFGLNVTLTSVFNFVVLLFYRVIRVSFA